MVMTVIPFRPPHQRRSADGRGGHPPVVPMAGERHAQAGATTTLSAITGYLSARTGLIILHAVGDRLTATKERLPDLVATKLFRAAGNDVKPVTRRTQRRIEELVGAAARGEHASAMLWSEDGLVAYVAEAFPGPDATPDGAGDADDGGKQDDTLIVLRPLQGAPWSQADLSEAFGLSRREAEVAIAMTNGLQVAHIAKRLNLTDGTVRQYLKSIYSKTGTHNQIQLLAILFGGANMRQLDEDDC